MMVNEVPFSRYYAIKLFCVKWSLFPRRVTILQWTPKYDLQRMVEIMIREIGKIVENEKLTKS